MSVCTEQQHSLMAETMKISTPSMRATRIIALFIVMLSLEATNRCRAIKTHTSVNGQDEDEYDDNGSIDELLSEQQPAAASGPRRTLQTDDGTVRAELDMVFTEEQWMSRQNRIHGSRHRRKAVIDSNRHWPNAIVPYVLSDIFNYKEQEILRNAMQQFQAYSCVRFRTRNSKDTHYVEFRRAEVCESYVGRQDRPQPLRLNLQCARSVKMVLHKLGHVLGFEHEHNRPDRDEFVIINESNVLSDMLHVFYKASSEEVDISDVPYDYLSIMHYGEKAFSKDRLSTTIHAKNSSYQHKMGLSNGLTFNDVKHLNKMYQCAELSRCARRMKCPGDGFVGHDCKCYCRPPTSSGRAPPAVLCSECADYDKELCSMFRQRGYCTHRFLSDHMTYRCPQACNRCTV